MATPVTHILYIFKYESPGQQAEDAKMMELLNFINQNIETINEMKIKMDIRTYTQRQMLSNAALVAQIRKDGIVFPSVCTPNKTYSGFDDIHRLYITNIQSFKKYEKKVEKPAPSGRGDDLEEYMRSAITTDDKDDDEESESLSGGKGLNSQVAAAMAARGSKKPEKPIRGIAPLREPDNVKHNRESFPQTISRLKMPQQTETGGIRGGAMTEDDGERDGDSYKDDAMLRAAAAREEDSLQIND